jgi:hypothetical protein
MKSFQGGRALPFSHRRAEEAPYVHRPADLPVGEQFLLWALRQWQCELSAWERDGAFPAGESGLRDGFRMAGLSEALPEFAMAMDAILFGIGRTLEIQRPSCPTVSRDEAVLIALCALAQAHLGGPLTASLDAMLGSGAAEVVVARLTAFAAMLCAAGLQLSPVEGETGGRLH